MPKLFTLLVVSILCNACLAVGESKLSGRRSNRPDGRVQHWDAQADLTPEELAFYQAKGALYPPKRRELESGFFSFPFLVYTSGSSFFREYHAPLKYSAGSSDDWLLGLASHESELTQYSEDGKRVRQDRDTLFLLGLLYHDWESFEFSGQEKNKTEFGWSVLWGLLGQNTKEGKSQWRILWVF